MSDKGFVMYYSYLDTMEDLTDAEFGRLVRAALEYGASGAIRQLSGAERFLFKTLKRQLDTDKERYRAICERNKINGKNGGRPKEKADCEDDKKTQKTQSVISEPKKPNINENENKNINKESIANAIPKKAAETHELFDQFWSVYPKKVAKQAAIKAFRKIPNIEATLDKILEGVEKGLKSEQWLKDNGQFIPNPSTFLNGRRWEDELRDSYACNDHDSELSKPSYDIDEYEEHSIFDDEEWEKKWTKKN